MRKIQPSQILVFVLLFSLACFLAWGTDSLAVDPLPLGDYQAIAKVSGFIVLLYAWALALFRVFCTRFPLPVGEIAPGSRAEFTYHVYLLFFLVLFNPLMRSGFIPVPLMRLIYQALGAKMGANSYSSGVLFDPPFISMGSNCIVGQSALLIPHVIEGMKLAHHPITLGSNVTIGASSVVLAGVTIGDGAIVSSGAVVPKGSVIAPGEIWGGIPARPLRRSPNAKAD